MRKLNNRRAKLLGVKLDSEIFDNLLVESATRKITVSELVRELINNHQLQGAEAEEPKERIRQLRGEVKNLRRDLGLVTELILIHALKIPKEQAREWVVKTFRIGS